MLDYRKMMHLYERGASKNNLATIFGCKWETVDRAITRINEMWGDCDSIPSDLTNDQIRRLIIRPTRERDEDYLWPDFSLLSKKDLKKMKHVLWDKYVAEALEQGKKAYQQSKFNALLDGYRVSQDISYLQSHDPGLECQVDWTGDHGHYMDPDTGEWIDVHVMVISMPYSGYFFSEGFLDEKMDSFLKGHEDAFRFFGGVPAITVPDNCATATDRKTGLINTRYAEFLDFYGSLPKPTRVKAPKDKGNVEAHVKIVENSIIPELDSMPILSLEEYNRLLLAKVQAKNMGPRSKKDGTRLEAFTDEEKPRLKPLPTASWKKTVERELTVSRDFHIQYSNAFYSVPVDYIGQKVTARDDGTYVRIYTGKGICIAEHRKAGRRWQRCTDPKHVPLGHDVGGREYSLDYFLNWACKFGPNTEALCREISDDFLFEVQSFRVLNAILAKAGRCRNPRAVEAASEKCIFGHVHTAKGFSSILASTIDRIKVEDEGPVDFNSLFCTRYGEGDEDGKKN